MRTITRLGSGIAILLAVGPWVTQMDEFLVSGESHVRNLRIGLERARELGDDPIVGYLPDQFGHIGQMPRILRDAGLGWAMVWRGVPRAVDRSTFRWQSSGGEAEVRRGLPVRRRDGLPGLAAAAAPVE